MRTDAYDCNACPAYCCAFPKTGVRPSDVKRLADGLGVSTEHVEQNYLKPIDQFGNLNLKTTPDHVFGMPSCVFLHKEERHCTVYEHRPRVCRDYPYTERCEWHDRRTIEEQLAGRRVVMLREAPWTITRDHPVYKGRQVAAVRGEYSEA